MTDEFLEDFRSEALENLQEVEDSAMALEEGDEEAVHRSFRALHSIKGNSSFFDLIGINSLAHHLEQILQQVREGGMAVSAELCDLILRGVDVLRGDLAALPASADNDDERAAVITQVQELLQSVCSGGPAVVDTTGALLAQIERRGGQGGSTVTRVAQVEAARPSLATFLLERGYLTAEQIVQSLVEQAASEASEIDMLAVNGRLSAEECIAIADHAVISRRSPFTACAALGYLERSELRRLRQRKLAERRPLAQVVVGLGMADRATVSGWLEEFMHQRQTRRVAPDEGGGS